ncbi:PilZ domain-containing protein [Sphingomonas sp. URHD0057]|uniref:PilZ domain-containing protein n=1 Tax=Sphingomonas sp. URHD0057 TaxID=1380389 RepID=UPI00048CEB43|nr:PilZ domain-containing protein [Sphingomonas sp. URHD0057]
MKERVEPRTNLFVLATLRSASGVAPVKVRDVSSTGMLLEGAAIPCVGTEVQIERASSVASGCIVWTAGGRAGVKFNSSADVQDWLPNRSNGQTRVDAMVKTIRSGMAPALAPRSVTPGPTLECDLAGLADEVELVSASLANDPRVLSHRHEELQRLDIVVQRLRLIAESSPKRI